MKRILFKAMLLSVAGITVVSCSDDTLSPSQSQASVVTSDDVYRTEDDKLKETFAKAFAQALNESQQLRELIKASAKERFNNDTELLFEAIRAASLESGNVEQLLLSHYQDANDLHKLLSSVPDLTILVPTLPEESFNVDNWNISDVPAVAVRLDQDNNVPAYFADGTEEIIQSQMIPGFPVIVIKNNERVVAQSNNQFATLNTRTIITRSGASFKFLDDCFDASKNNKNTTMRPIVNNLIDPTLLTAWQTYDWQQNDGWQRDYVYYGITPTNPNGPFSYDYQETITGFRMTGNAQQAYDKIVDQTDPTRRNELYTQAQTTQLSSHWTEGSFEFKVRCIYNAKSGGGEEIIKYIPANPWEIFQFSFKKVNQWPFQNYYTISTMTNMFKSVNLPLFNWNLDEYASTVKYEVEEVDLTMTTTTTDSRSVKFATNFGFDLGWGEKVKYGLKFGASAETTTTSTVSKQVTEGNDQLGEFIVNFADKIVYRVPQISSYFIGRDYPTGWCELSIEPTRVQH